LRHATPEKAVPAPADTPDLGHAAFLRSPQAAAEKTRAGHAKLHACAEFNFS